MGSNNKPLNSKGVTLKRTVTIKAVVTSKFKEYMGFELQDGIKNTNARIQELESKLESVRSQSNLDGNASVAIANYESEKLQLEQSLLDINQRVEVISNLELDGYYVQGMVDGFVNVNVGDNLYEKLGAMEIVIKDGLVQSIDALMDRAQSAISAS